MKNKNEFCVKCGTKNNVKEACNYNKDGNMSKSLKSLKIIYIVIFIIVAISMLFSIPNFPASGKDIFIEKIRGFIFISIAFILPGVLVQFSSMRKKVPLFKREKLLSTILGFLILFFIVVFASQSINLFHSTEFLIEQSKYSAELKSQQEAERNAKTVEKSEAQKAKTEKEAAKKTDAEKAATDKAAAEKAATEKAAQEKEAAEKAAAEKAATEKVAQEKAATEKAAAEKVAAEKAAAEEAAYYAQFSWYNKDFGVINDSGSSDNFGFVTINGRAMAFNRDYSYVQITYGIYSSNGNKVGSAFANINNLAKGTTWQFSAIGTRSDSGNFKYKVEDVIGW